MVNKWKLKCPHCYYIGPCRIKLGGLVCENCDSIMYGPETKEYKEVAKPKPKKAK